MAPQLRAMMASHAYILQTMGCLSLRMCFSGFTGEPNVVYLTYLPHAEGRKMLICMALLGNTKNCNVRDTSHE
jgi:hypothetical protein